MAQSDFLKLGLAKNDVKSVACNVDAENKLKLTVTTNDDKIIESLPQALPVATDTNFGGIKASIAAASQSEDVGIDSTTGKLKTKKIPVITVTENSDGTVNIDIS